MSLLVWLYICRVTDFLCNLFLIEQKVAYRHCRSCLKKKKTGSRSSNVCLFVCNVMSAVSRQIHILMTNLTSLVRKATCIVTTVVWAKLRGSGKLLIFRLCLPYLPLHSTGFQGWTHVWVPTVCSFQGWCSKCIGAMWSHASRNILLQWEEQDSFSVILFYFSSFISSKRENTAFSSVSVTVC